MRVGGGLAIEEGEERRGGKKNRSDVGEGGKRAVREKRRRAKGKGQGRREEERKRKTESEKTEIPGCEISRNVCLRAIKHYRAARVMKSRTKIIGKFGEEVVSRTQRAMCIF